MTTDRTHATHARTAQPSGVRHAPEGARSRLRAALILAAAVIGTLASTIAPAQDPQQTVRVTGRGATPYEARQDAIRQALQAAVKQLVVSQQVVQNDKLILDRISSTMNGFVNRFTTVGTTRDGKDFLIDAEVEVSTSRVRNYVGSVSGSRVRIDSESILAAVEQEKLARNAAGEVAAGLFRDFPMRVIESGPPRFSIDPADPDRVNFEVQMWIAPGFIRNLRRALRQLGASSVSCDSAFDECAIEADEPDLLVCFATQYLQPRGAGGFTGRARLVEAGARGCLRVAPLSVAAFGWPRPPAARDRKSGRGESRSEVTGEFAVALMGNGAPLIVSLGDDVGQTAAFSSSWAGTPTRAGGIALRSVTLVISTGRFVVKGSLPSARLQGIDTIDALPLVSISRGSVSSSDPLHFLKELIPASVAVPSSELRDLLRALSNEVIAGPR
jgi:hypothetical protein